MNWTDSERSGLIENRKEFGLAMGSAGKAAGSRFFSERNKKGWL